MILRISSTRLSGESAYLWNKNEVPEDDRRVRPPVAAGTVDGGDAVFAATRQLLFPRAKRWSTRNRTPRAILCRTADGRLPGFPRSLEALPATYRSHRWTVLARDVERQEGARR